MTKQRLAGAAVRSFRDGGIQSIVWTFLSPLQPCFFPLFRDRLDPDDRFAGTFLAGVPGISGRAEPVADGVGTRREIGVMNVRYWQTAQACN